MAGQTVGFVGIGNMGGAMAARLRKSGHDLILFDVGGSAILELERQGARIAASSAEIGAEAETVFLSLPTPDIVSAVSDEVAGGGRVTNIVDLSTTGPDMARVIGARLRDRGITLVDCPVSGGVAGARAGTLALMVGAPATALECVRPLLDCFGKVFHVGPVAGMGQMMKVINNLMSACALSVSAEAITMAVKAGLDAETVVAVVNAGSGRNSATLDKFPRQILPGTFDAGFSIGLMLKDIELCIKQADAMGLSMPAARAVAACWAEAEAQLGPDADFTRIVQLAESASGVEVRRRASELGDV